MIIYLHFHHHAKAGDASVHNLHYGKIQGKQESGTKRSKKPEVILYLTLSRQFITTGRLLKCEEH